MNTSQAVDFEANADALTRCEYAGDSADWAAIGVVLISITTFAAAQGLTYPLMSLALESSGVSETLIGVNAAFYAFGLALPTLLISRLTQWINGDRLLVLAIAGCAVCLALFARFDAFWVWCAVRFVLGICAGLVFILSEAWLSSACPENLRGRITGLFSAGMALGFAAGPLAIPVFGTEGGLAFALNAAYLGVVAFVTLLLVRRTHTRPAASSSGQILGFVRKAPLLVAMVVVFGFVDIAAISTMPVYFVKTGHTEAFAALSVTIMALPTAAAQPVIGFLLDKAPRILVVVGTSVIAACGFLIIPLLQSEMLILVVFGLIGATTFALYTCALTILGEGFRGGFLVAGCAVFSLANALGSAGGSTVTGAAMNVFGPVATPLTASLALLVFALVYGFVRR